MDKPDERLEISALGTDVVLRPAGANSSEREFVFDVIGRPRGFITQRHVHSDQVERYEVIAGSMRVVAGRRTHVLEPGQRLEVAAGTPHRQLPAGDGAGHVRVTVTPAGRTEEFLRGLCELSRQGQINRAGFPRPLAAARLIDGFSDTGHATFPPPALQRPLARLILRGAALAGAVRAAPAGAARRLWREYEFVDQWDVAAPPEAVYDALADSRTYPEWWRPVYVEVAADGPPRVGGVSLQHFKGRLPYHLHTRSITVQLIPGELIEAEVDGDLRGRGVWRLRPSATGTHVRFDWTVHADRRLLRVLTPVLRPALRANHSWAIARAVDGLEPFARRGLGRDGVSGAGEARTALIEVTT